MFWNKEKNGENGVSFPHKKWQNIALNTNSIDIGKLEKNIKLLYKKIGRKEPQIIYSESPYLMWENVLHLSLKNIELKEFKKIETFIKSNLSKSNSGFLKPFVFQVVSILKKQLLVETGNSLKAEIEAFLWEEKAPDDDNKNRENELNDSLKENNLTHIALQLETALNSLLFINTLQEITLRISDINIKKSLTKISESLLENKSNQFLNSLGNLLGKNLFSRFCIKKEFWIIEALKKDLDKTGLNKFFPSQNWSLMEEITNNCGWILPYEKYCFISDRPPSFNINKQYLLHAEEKLAIEFKDGNGFYAYEGVIMPEKYGKLKAENWQSKWILEEENAELRRVLIQGLGYDKIASELEAQEIDSWREYTILKFNKIIDHLDEQPICLLKMTCPSTNFIHALRIPPDFTSAREAIKWINWGVDPEEIIIAS